MIGPYVRKLIVVDDRFLSDLSLSSRTAYADFMAPQLDTQIVDLSGRSSAELASLTDLVDVSDLNPGSIVIRPHYSDHFIPIEEVTEDLATRKFGLLARFCLMLGAKKISISNLESIDAYLSAGNESSASGEGHLPGAKAEMVMANKKSELTEDLSLSMLRFNTAAQGGEPDLENAAAMMEQYKLHKDPLFSDIVNMRRLQNNRLYRHEFSLDVSKDVRKILDSSIDAKIKAMAKVYGGKAAFERTLTAVNKSKLATKLSIVVEF